MKRIIYQYLHTYNSIMTNISSIGNRDTDNRSNPALPGNFSAKLAVFLMMVFLLPFQDKAQYLMSCTLPMSLEHARLRETLEFSIAKNVDIKQGPMPKLLLRQPILSGVTKRGGKTDNPDWLSSCFSVAAGIQK